MTGSMQALPELTRTRAAELFTDETGAATAEYAITTMAAVASPGCSSSYALGRGGGILTDLVRRALTVA